jgi:hypothetical protein
LSNFIYEIFEKVLILVGSLLLKGLMVKWGGVLGHFLLWILPVILYLLLLSIFSSFASEIVRDSWNGSVGKG